MSLTARAAHHVRTLAPDVFDLRRVAPSIKVSKPPKSEARYLASLKTRVDKIQAALAAQPKKQADYKKTLPSKPLNKGILQYIRKNAWEKE
jgi:hypothetical protein